MSLHFSCTQETVIFFWVLVIYIMSVLSSDDIESEIMKLFILAYESNVGRKPISELYRNNPVYMYRGLENLKIKDTVYIKVKRGKYMFGNYPKL